MAIQVTYRRTRRLSMRIVKNGDVHVSAPIGMPKKEVERFIEDLHLTHPLYLYEVQDRCQPGLYFRKDWKSQVEPRCAERYH